MNLTTIYLQAFKKNQTGQIVKAECCKWVSIEHWVVALSTEESGIGDHNWWKVAPCSFRHSQKSDSHEFVLTTHSELSILYSTLILSVRNNHENRSSKNKPPKNQTNIVYHTRTFANIRVRPINWMYANIRNYDYDRSNPPLFPHIFATSLLQLFLWIYLFLNHSWCDGKITVANSQNWMALWCFIAYFVCLNYATNWFFITNISYLAYFCWMIKENIQTFSRHEPLSELMHVVT